jgi:hypothetical protein
MLKELDIALRSRRGPGAPRAKGATLPVALLFVGVLLFVGYDVVINGPEARKHLQVLEHEAQRIAPPPGATRLSVSPRHKPGQAGLSTAYETPLPYAQLRAHYDTALAAQGWTLQGEAPLRDWGKDLGGRTAQYRKGEYTAALQFAGAEADYGWTYALELEWKRGGN